jgi:hypothetical protein
MSGFTLDKLPKKVLTQIYFQSGFLAPRFLNAAEKLQIFRILGGRKVLTSAAVGRKAGLHADYRENFLNILVKLGLLRKKNNLYSNTPLAEKYFVRERSIYWNKLYADECIMDYKALNNLEDILTFGRKSKTIQSQKHRSEYDFLRDDPVWADNFTRMLFEFHKPDATKLAHALDLSKFNSLLDVGGGSGVMSMALVRKYPQLTACVMDFANVCRVTEKLIRQEKLTGRIKTRAGDMNRKIPRGFDVIMFYDIGRLDPRVIKNAYNSLPPGGMFVFGGVLYRKGKSESLNMLMRRFIPTSNQTQSWEELKSNLDDCGFKSINKRNFFENCRLVTARK